MKKWKKLVKFQPIMIVTRFDPSGVHYVWIKIDKWPFNDETTVVGPVNTHRMSVNRP